MSMRPTQLVWILTLALSFIASTAVAQTDPAGPWIAQLGSLEPGERAEAAKELREDGGPPPHAVGPLLYAAHREMDHGALREMLLTLGHSGMVEALGLIQTHARSPADDIRSTARRALRKWLQINRVLGENDDLPDPPHAYYNAPPRLPPDRRGGHSLATWLRYEPYAPPPEPTDPAPAYLSPSPDGLMPGTGVEETPKWKLIAAGMSVFGGLYAATTIGALAVDDEEPDARVFIPIAGPLFPAASLFDASGDFAGIAHFFGGLLVVDAIGQTAGIALIIAGASTTNEHLIRVNDRMGLDVSPTGVTLGGSF
jgi:hypothetical protein